MTVTLSTTEVATLTGATVTDDDITDAEWLLRTDTGLSPTEHNTLRSVPTTVIQRAWAIVAARLATLSTDAGSEGVTTESQGDYSYSADIGTVAVFRDDPMTGLPRTLLAEAEGSAVRLRPGDTVLGKVSGYQLWTDGD